MLIYAVDYGSEVKFFDTIEEAKQEADEHRQWSIKPVVSTISLAAALNEMSKRIDKIIDTLDYHNL